MDDTTFSTDALIATLADTFYGHLIETEDAIAHIATLSACAPIIMRAAFVRNLKRFDDEEIAPKVPKGWKVKEIRERTLVTLLGAITYRRRIYIDGIGRRRCLLDEVLGIARYQRIAPDAFRWIVLRAADVSYRKAARLFADKCGCVISAMAVMRCVHACGTLLGKQAPTTDGAITTPVLFCEFDGLWISQQSAERHYPALPRATYLERYRSKSKEYKVWVTYAGKKRQGARMRRIHPVHWVSDRPPGGFFEECVKRTGQSYDIAAASYLVVSSDAAGWCKAHGLDAWADKRSVVISRLDTFHVNQALYRAFSDAGDRDTYLRLLYAKDIGGFLAALKDRIAQEPHDERIERRRELAAYISNNTDLLEGPSLARTIRGQLLEDIPCVFKDRRFCAWLTELLAKRRYKRFLDVLGKVASRCVEGLAYDYGCFLADAKEAVRLIRVFGHMGAGTMEGTNSKVYAARLKVWGCSWSEHGALSMLRIRAAIANGEVLPAPGYTSWMSDTEREAEEKARALGPADIPERVGEGYEPPQGSVANCNSIPPSIFRTYRN
jgi:hypothetical protein